MCVERLWKSSVGDPWYYPKGSAWVRETRMGVRNPRYYPKRFCMGVRDPQYPKRFYMGVKDLRCKPKSFVAQKKTHGHIHHLDLELSDRSLD